MKRLAPALLVALLALPAHAAESTGAAGAALQEAGGPTSALQLAILLGLASLLPAIVLLGTCFARFVIVFSFLKSGLGAQGTPPNQVLVGLSLFMTAFVMAPVASALHETSLGPYMRGELNEEAALEAAAPTMRAFLLPRTRQEDLALFYDAAKLPRPQTAEEVPLRIAVPSYVLSELRTSFEMGLALLLPFLVIDLVVATVLMSLGMMMVPPATVSLPLKLMVFLAVDGWHLVVSSLLRGVSV